MPDIRRVHRSRQMTFPHKPVAGARQVRHRIEKELAEPTVRILAADDQSMRRLVPCHPL